MSLAELFPSKPAIIKAKDAKAGNCYFCGENAQKKFECENGKALFLCERHLEPFADVLKCFN